MDLAAIRISRKFVATSILKIGLYPIKFISQQVINII